jgi:hypothetical protein
LTKDKEESNNTMINPKTTVPSVVTAFNPLFLLNRVIHKVLEDINQKILRKILAIFVPRNKNNDKGDEGNGG